MKIVRDGKELELTRDELYQAYLEQQYLFDISSVKSNMEVYLDDEEYETLGDNQEFIEDVADELRRNINKYDMNFEFAIEEAFDTIKERYLDLDKEEKTLLDQFKEYCWKKADAASDRYNQNHTGKYIVYDGMWDSDKDECNLYSETADYFLDNCPEWFDSCETIEDLEDVLEERKEDILWDSKLYDERTNLSYGDAELNGVAILEVGSIGRWDGKRHGLNVLEPNNIGELLTSDCEQWICYVDKKSGDFYKSEFHHDGANYYEYRELTCDKYEFEDMLDNAKPGEMDELVEKYSKPIGWRIANVYGWNLNNKSVDTLIHNAKNECEELNNQPVIKEHSNDLEK